MSAKEIADRIKSYGPEFVIRYTEKLNRAVDRLLHLELDMTAFRLLQILQELKSVT